MSCTTNKISHTHTRAPRRAHTRGLLAAAVAASPAADPGKVTGRRTHFGARLRMLQPARARRACLLRADASRTRARAHPDALPGSRCRCGVPDALCAREARVPVATLFPCNHRLLGFLRLCPDVHHFWLEIAQPDVYMIILVGSSWHRATHVIVYACGSSYLFWGNNR